MKHAERDDGFSLVHELTHNLMDRSHLANSIYDRYPRGGNRLLDEGFGVYVEERLVDHGRVFPNFGKETHGAYLEALPEVYGRDLPELEQEWLAFLDSLSSTD